MEMNEVKMRTALRDTIGKMFDEGSRSMENDYGNLGICIDVSRRRIQIPIYTIKDVGLPLPVVEEELATAVCNARNHRYMKEYDSDPIQPYVIRLYHTYWSGEFHMPRE